MRKTNASVLMMTIALMLAACAMPQTGAMPTAVQQAKEAAATAAPTIQAAATQVSEAVATAMPKAQEAMDMAALIAAAQAEGELNVIALPHDWCNYGEMIETFKQKYGLKVNEITPDAGSAEELEAVKANKDNKGPQAPDVLDIGPAFAVQAVEEDLVAPYKVSTWDTIPDNLKHPDGLWTGNYYGVMAMQVNVDAVPAVPQDFADLLKPEYKGMVSINDPRIGNSQAQAVFNAALAMGGSPDDSSKGLEFFAQLNAIGNFLPSWNQQTFGRGETPIVFDWDYNALAQRDANKDSINIEVVIPKSAQLAGHYATAISKYAPHPNAAKLWMEHVFSDEGSLIWIKGYCHPTRYNDLVARKVIPEDLAAKLPSDELYAKATFPTLEQLNKHKQLLAENWDKVTKIEFRKLQ
ncbi:MAG: iron ABC transporter substrate-binding protein [Candidatus Roseilinea sp.]|nr:MAG: iron ABC transporter substrate-binding protein [Candidatus Roseilinea sp.]